ncbi:MAG TPA: ASCH domain-containing protein [Symbiobacteriaceae bacterium]|jgi:ASC-1-like (ASCH) protein|nr:ASCH domain-containing protein [Symbiobacteriaceae bacterium]
MQHEMGLFAGPYEAIHAGRKRFEIRLHDEKRRRIAVGDTIAFTRLPDGAGPLRVEVVGLRPYPSFQRLYEEVPLAAIDCDGWSMEELLSSTYKIYTREQEAQFGALAIEIRLLP